MYRFLFILLVASVAVLPAQGDTSATATPAPLSGCGGTSASGDLTLLTNSGTGPTCGGSGSGPDAWYEFTSPITGTINFDLCGTGFDTTLSAFDGAPGALNEVVCNDDSCGLQSAISIAATMGTQYFIRVGSFGSGGGGPYTLNEGGLGGSINTAESSLNINGSTAVSVCEGAAATLNASTSVGAGALHDIGVGPLAAVPLALLDDCIELDLATAVSVWTGGAAANPLLPFGGGLGVSSLSVGFVPNTGEYDLQMGVLDAGDPDGISMSATTHMSVIGTVIPLALGDDANLLVDGACFADVNFYGTMYDHCYVGSNGDVTFTAGSSDFTATYGEWASGMPRIGWAADLQPNVYGTVTYNGLTDGFRVDYTDMSEWGTTGAGVISYSVEVSASAGASITGMTEDGTWGGTTQCLGASNGSLGTDPGVADFAALFAGGGVGAGAATDMWVDDGAAGGMVPGAGSTYSNILFPAADGSSILIN